LPAAGFVEWTFACAKALGEAFPLELNDVSFTSKLSLEAGKARVAQICVAEKHFRILSLSADEEWTLHVQGDVVADSAALQHGRFEAAHDLQPRRDAVRLSANAFYERLQRDGVMYGPSLRGVQEVWHRHHDAFAHIEVPPAALVDGPRYCL